MTKARSPNPPVTTPVTMTTPMTKGSPNPFVVLPTDSIAGISSSSDPPGGGCDGPKDSSNPCGGYVPPPLSTSGDGCSD